MSSIHTFGWDIRSHSQNITPDMEDLIYVIVEGGNLSGLAGH